MVTGTCWAAPLKVMAIGVFVLGSSACGSFEPVKARRFTLLTEENFAQLKIASTHWKAYDDQHSRKSACTNNAAGGHQPEQCSTLVDPYFAWDGQKCPPTGAAQREVDDGGHVTAKGNGSICLGGSAAALLGCNEQTYDRCSDKNYDSSNIWGAGIALEIKTEDDKPWNARLNGVTGVAFDLSYLPESDDLHLRVEIPISLSTEETSIPIDRPVTMEDGAVIGQSNDAIQLYRGDCSADHPTQTDWGRPRPTKLKELLVASQGQDEVSSEQHPFGSPFWQPASNWQEPLDPKWITSRVVIGHNEFKWDEVYPPPELAHNYSFSEEKILGIQFHVVPQKTPTKAIPFYFCLENLAFLSEE